MKILFILLLLLIESCSLFKRKGTWGKNALWPLHGTRLVDALKDNATSWHVLVPLAGAGALHWGGYDNKISEWADHEKLIYQDQTAADNWSDNFNDVLKYEMFLTPLFTASSDEENHFGNYVGSKLKGYGVIAISSRIPDFTHDRLAKAVHRERPNHGDFRSFPSGHATQAGTRNRITSKNLKSIPMNANLRVGINSLNTTMAAGVMWARVEGKRHYPSDVLVGYALGSFLSGFLYDFLMNQNQMESFVIVPTGEKTYVQYSLAF